MRCRKPLWICVSPFYWLGTDCLMVLQEPQRLLWEPRGRCQPLWHCSLSRRMWALALLPQVTTHTDKLSHSGVRSAVGRPWTCRAMKSWVYLGCSCYAFGLLLFSCGARRPLKVPVICFVLMSPLSGIFSFFQINMPSLCCCCLSATSEQVRKQLPCCCQRCRRDVE